VIAFDVSYHSQRSWERVAERGETIGAAAGDDQSRASSVKNSRHP
jgi:hypothetical protein